MTLLVPGLALWWVAHLLKRLAPGMRAGLAARLGSGPSRGVIAVPLFAALGLMIIGYRAAEYSPVYTPPAWGWHLNNLMMYGAVLLFGAGNSKGRLRSLLRHPMLTGVVVWSVAHLLVNGDLASVTLFGGLGLWALVEMAVIDRTSPAWVRPAPGPLAGDIRLAVIALVIYAAIIAVHWLVLGVKPFPG